ncbi:MAG: hypothetical protein COA44_05935 [Arcobacter sp.]|nr:MAG: hypothetical protein COA44_05935 [Arcobacter sp.]
MFNFSELQASETYILSYRAQVKNAVVISESFYLTPSMKEIHAKPMQVLKIDATNESNLHEILKKNKDVLLEFLMKYGTHTRSHEKVHNYKSSSLISITIPPTYITVDFKNDYAIITRLLLD